jgi:hypothetical protein
VKKMRIWHDISLIMPMLLIELFFDPSSFL